jgi:hypothetical protein
VVQGQGLSFTGSKIQFFSSLRDDDLWGELVTVAKLLVESYLQGRVCVVLLGVV